MRLTEDQVKKAIFSSDRDVRSAAVHYFAQSYSTDCGIMPLAIQAIEQFGWKDAFEFYSFPTRLRQTDETVLWLVGQLKRYGDSKNEDEWCYAHATMRGLIKSDAAILERHQSEILNLDELEDEAKKDISERIALRSKSAEELWDELEEFCTRSDKLDKVPDDLDLADHLVEALGRHSEFSVPKVLTILTGTPANNWMELCAVRLAGELRLQDAIPAIVALHEEPDDWIFEDGHRALAKIGGDRVVEQFARRYPAGSSDLQSSAASVLENIHSDLSVETCLKFFETEQDHRIRCNLLQSVLMNFSTEGIESARHLILTTPLDPQVLQVRSDLLTACKVMGERFPELDEWTEDSKNDVEFRKNWYRNMVSPSDEFELDDDEVVIDAPPDRIVRHAHVGRNDPCPCGSGKKFKKCCMQKQESAPRAAKQTEYPIWTVALYGPDDKVTTKIVAAVIRRPDADPVLERWVGTNIASNPKVRRQITALFERHGVKSVVATDRNMGCPHEEGQDFPHGEDCHFCPHWSRKQGSNRRD